MNVPIVNLAGAHFDCTFGRGCEGICCRNGRPPVYADEARRIGENLQRVLAWLRPEAREVVERNGFLSRRRKAGQPMARVAGGWCVFFNRGCVLHRLGADEGDPFRYKPWTCAVFPLSKDEQGHWHVRQKGHAGKIWDLPCLDPAATPLSAATTLRAEIALVQDWENR